MTKKRKQYELQNTTHKIKILSTVPAPLVTPVVLLLNDIILAAYSFFLFHLLCYALFVFLFYLTYFVNFFPGVVFSMLICLLPLLYFLCLFVFYLYCIFYVNLPFTSVAFSMLICLLPLLSFL